LKTRLNERRKKMKAKILTKKTLWASVALLSALGLFFALAKAADDGAKTTSDEDKPVAGDSNKERSDDEQKVDAKGLSRFINGYSQMKKVGDLLVAYYPMAGKIAVGHKAYGYRRLFHTLPTWNAPAAKPRL
jgi:hypothetical protein